MLNSVLLEGNLIADPTVKEVSGDECAVNFTLESHRFIKIDGEQECLRSYFDVYVAGGKLGRACAGSLKKGRGVRVVGRLETGRHSEDFSGKELTWVVAEHVEFKPVRSKPEHEHAET